MCARSAVRQESIQCGFEIRNLYVLSRKVYFSDRSLEYPRIESVSMDGNDRTTIVGNELLVPNMLAIDVEVSIVAKAIWTWTGHQLKWSKLSTFSILNLLVKRFPTFLGGSRGQA